MKLGDVLKLEVQKLPASTSEKDLQIAFGKYGAIQSLTLHKGYAEVSLVWNGTELVDSSGMGEIRLPDGAAVPVIPARK